MGGRRLKNAALAGSGSGTGVVPRAVRALAEPSGCHRSDDGCLHPSSREMVKIDPKRADKSLFMMRRGEAALEERFLLFRCLSFEQGRRMFAGGVGLSAQHSRQFLHALFFV